MFHTSGVKVAGVDHEELGLYLALHRTSTELEQMGLSPFCPTRKKKRGRAPTITGCATSGCKDKRFEPWVPPARIPGKSDVRRMFTEALKIVLMFIMTNHLYTFDNQVKLQSKGGPIGLQLTGVLAQIFMVWWERQLTEKMEKIGLDVRLYKRYVDDINTVMVATKVGLRYDGVNLVGDETSVKADEGIAPDKRTMLLFMAVGNSIHPSIQLEVDYPSQHGDGKLPVLDLKMWVEENEKNREQRGYQVVMHEFYAKEVSSKSVVSAKSALSWGSKRTILTQEVLRILLNCSPKLPWEVVVSHVNNMMLRLQYSGYNQKFRTRVVVSAMKAYKNICLQDANGVTPMYRSREWRQSQCSEEKSRKKETWYKRDGCDSVIFVPATPNSELKRRYDEQIRQAGFRMKVIEQSGTTLRKKLQRSNPFKDKRCRRDDCMVCENEGKGSCRATGVTYEIACKECKCKYVGETARSGYSRGTEHEQLAGSSEERSALLRHAKSCHQGTPNFTMNVTGVFGDDAMLRQITESVHIKNTPPQELLNSKKEWNYYNIPRATVVMED